METTDSIFQRIENTICGGRFEKLGLLRNITCANIKGYINRQIPNHLT
ncbi:hypothetical protein MTBBW1_440023 [Desulfamplus magnetovallimortis]|uniref:Uncharacterized protein n=1 Tax=Desulfamplus magnetovallimortis TaxID=1246637 RepID=A0A1W1HHG6_9BACT|nr:hypothetical protein MTBBW1_440023 [Desulfamplus magnetovallimortis]